MVIASALIKTAKKIFYGTKCVCEGGPLLQGDMFPPSLRKSSGAPKMHGDPVPVLQDLIRLVANQNAVRCNSAKRLSYSESLPLLKHVQKASRFGKTTSCLFFFFAPNASLLQTGNTDQRDNRLSKAMEKKILTQQKSAL